MPIDHKAIAEEMDMALEEHSRDIKKSVQEEVLRARKERMYKVASQIVSQWVTPDTTENDVRYYTEKALALAKIFNTVFYLEFEKAYGNDE